MKKWLAIIFSLALLAGLWGSGEIDGALREAQSLLLTATPWSVGVAILLFWLNFAASTERYRLLLIHMKLPHPAFVPLFSLTFLSLFLAHFIPIGPAADAVRIGYARLAFKWPFAKAIESVVYDRMLALLGLTLTGILMLPLQILHGISRSIWLPQAVIYSGILAGVVILAIAARLPVVKRRFFFLSHITNSINGFSSVAFTVGGVAMHMLLAIAYMGSFGVVIWVLAHGVNLSPDLFQILQFSAFILLAQNLPLFYMGWGGREVAFASTLGAAGILTPGQSLAVSVAVGAALFLAALPGAVMWMRVPKSQEKYDR